MIRVIGGAQRAAGPEFSRQFSPGLGRPCKPSARTAAEPAPAQGQAVARPATTRIPAGQPTAATPASGGIAHRG